MKKWTYIARLSKATNRPTPDFIQVEEDGVPPGTPLFETRREAVEAYRESSKG